MHELAEEAERARARLSILAEVGGLLGGSIDLATMVSAVARLLVSRLVDVCAVELIDGPGVAALTVVEPPVISAEAERALDRPRDRRHRPRRGPRARARGAGLRLRPLDPAPQLDVTRGLEPCAGDTVAGHVVPGRVACIVLHAAATAARFKAAPVTS